MTRLDDCANPADVPDLGDLLDLERYPLHERTSPLRQAALDAARADLERDGCAVIPGLVRRDAVRRLDDEIWARKNTTHYSTQAINPYFHVDPNPEFPDDHAVNTFLERSSGFVPGDSWEPGCATDVVFRSEHLTGFIAECLGIPELHCYADPLAGLTANVLDPGQQFTWHFDTNDFAVTVLVAEADEGGLFEYVPGIRSSEDEGFDDIKVILDGGRDNVHTLELRPGDLQIFRGRYSLHRVSRVASDSAPRHAAIFAYTAEPGVIGRVERTMQLFGRVLPEHEAAEHARVRSDELLD